MSTMNETVPYTVPREQGRWRAIVLAALMHLFLLLFLWVGIRWQNDTPQTVEAEVWSPQPREAAPLPVPPPPAPEVKAPEPKPEPKPIVKEPPKPVVEERPVVKPDIALEQEKKRKALEKKKQDEELAKQKQKEEELAKLKQKQKEEADKLAKARLEEERLKKDKLDKEKLEKEKVEKEKLAKAEKEKLEKEKLAKAEKEKKDKAEAKRKQDEAAAEKQLAKTREEEMARLTGAVGSGGTGEAAKSQGGRADSSYAARVGNKIKSNIVYIVPDELADNSPVEYAVDLLPDGSIAGIRKVRSSKAPGFDEAVRRAIEKSQPFPKDKSGAVPSSFIGIHRPKD
jgi:colicin import membrane protein